MIFFLAVFLVPAVIGLVAYFYGGKSFTTKELMAHMGIQLLVAGVCALFTYYHDTWDREIWNGVVASKARQQVSCEHHYCCRTCESCTTDSKGHTSCTSYCCAWCDHHPFDVDWRVYASINEQLNIDRIDWQGLKTPPRWTRVVVGEPYSSSHSFVNYIKAAPDTLFRRDGAYEKFAGILPEYPGMVFDYYRANRVVTVGLTLPDLGEWNRRLSVINGTIGARKQVNVVLVLVADQPPDFFPALEQKWLGGKKNDVVVVASVDHGTLEYQWIKVMAWTYNEMVKIKVRDDLMDTRVLQLEEVMRVLQEDVDQYFQRKHMSDFKYLSSTITPTPTAWVVSLVISFLAGIISSIVFVKFDAFQEGI